MLKPTLFLAFLLAAATAASAHPDARPPRGRMLTSEKSDTRTFLDELGAKMRRLEGVRALMQNMKDHFTSRMQSVFLFADKLAQLKKEELENHEKIKLLQEEKAKIKAANRALLAAALLPEKNRKV